MVVGILSLIVIICLSENHSKWLWLLLIMHVSIVCCCSSSEWFKCTKVRNSRCTIPNALRITHPFHNICIKVNASNPFDVATSNFSNETCIHLHDVGKFIALLYTTVICHLQLTVFRWMASFGLCTVYNFSIFYSNFVACSLEPYFKC